MAFFFPPEPPESKRKFAPAPPGHRYVQLSGKCFCDGEILLLPVDQVEYVRPFMRYTEMGADSRGIRLATEWTDMLRFVATGKACSLDNWGVEAEVFELVVPKDGKEAPKPPEFTA